MVFKFYLDKRNQYVQIKDTKSSNHMITCGVPHGSIICPLLFILYINDLHRTLRESSCLIFADDTIVFLRDNSLSILQT